MLLLSHLSKGTTRDQQQAESDYCTCYLLTWTCFQSSGKKEMPWTEEILIMAF